MIRITRQTDYGIVLLSQMAAAPLEEVHTAKHAAQQSGLPVPMASKILKALAREGLLVSHRGVRGGYRLAAAPELIVVWSNPAVIAMRAVDRSIPVVFVSVGDPVGSGFVESLGRPGGNMTGFTAFEPEMGGKWLEHLKEVAPALTRAMVLLHPDIAANFEFYRAAQAAGTALKINVDAVDVRGAADIQRAVSALAGEPHAGVLVLPNPASASHRDLIIGLASRLRLPAIYPFRYYALDGGLISYGPDTPDLFRRAAGYVDRILKGDPPASLPVQTPVKFELVINLKTAKALGLDVPATLLARADEVIE